MNKIKIGKITISKMTADSFWLIEDDGEGAQYPEEQLEALLAEFHNEHF